MDSQMAVAVTVSGTHREKAHEYRRRDEECLELKVELVVYLNHPIMEYGEIMRCDPRP